jgi:UDP-N-acetylmuramoylalanine--D-glutamate ligase
MSFDPKSYRRKLAAVLGLGKSGQAAARLLLRNGFKILGSDTRPRGALKAAIGNLAGKIALEAGGHGPRCLKAASAVKSPGVPPQAPVLDRLRQAGIPVFSELEVGLAFRPGLELAAITGTNGKTTTTALAAEMFRRGLPKGRRALAVGNIGLPVSAAASAAKSKDVFILEVSSYQLEDSVRFHARGAALLNITPDHMEHHGSMDAYIEAKSRIFREQKAEDFCVFNADDPLVFKLSRRAPGRRLYFGRKSAFVHAWAEGGVIRAKLPGGPELRFAPPDLPGEHNLANAMAAVLVALGWGIKPAAVQKALKSFRGVAHRLEDFGSVRGIRCVNDSKATNVDSTIVALRTFPKKNVLLILGGLHKGAPYRPLRPLVESSVKGIFTIGSAAVKVEDDLRGLVPIFPCGDLATAVKTALDVGSAGDVLLLSPACASSTSFKISRSAASGSRLWSRSADSAQKESAGLCLGRDLDRPGDRRTAHGFFSQRHPGGAQDRQLPFLLQAPAAFLYPGLGRYVVFQPIQLQPPEAVGLAGLCDDGYRADRGAVRARPGKSPPLAAAGSLHIAAFGIGQICLRPVLGLLSRPQAFQDRLSGARPAGSGRCGKHSAAAHRSGT